MWAVKAVKYDASPKQQCRVQGYLLYNTLAQCASCHAHVATSNADDMQVAVATALLKACSWPNA